MPQPELLEIFVFPLEDAGIKYMVTGSVAAIFYGEPRLTNDIDLVLHVDGKDIGRMPEIFPASRYYVPPFDVLKSELSRDSGARFNLIHHDSGMKADCYLFTGDPLHQWGLSQKRRIDMGNSRKVWLAPPEYVIIRKLQYFREGGSRKHISDIAGILSTSGSLIDWAALKKFLEKLGLIPIWISADLPQLQAGIITDNQT
jgi:hypothetical protein